MRVRFWLLVAAAAGALAAGAPIARAAEHAQLAAEGDFATTKDRYLAKAQSNLEDWRRKLGAMADTTAAQARSVGNTADAELNVAWRRTQVEAERLEAASSDGWDRAKRSFEQASEDLKASWNRAHPDDK